MTRMIVGNLARHGNPPPSGAIDDETPLVVLPEQCLLRRSRTGEGSRRLVAALVDDAVHCFTRNAIDRSSGGRRLFDEASHWLMDASTDAPVKFEFKCQALGLDIDELRTALRRWYVARGGSGTRGHGAVCNELNGAFR